MTFVVETGAGVPGATSYATPAFGTAYLTDRNRETEGGWSTAGDTRLKEALVVATSYIDTRWGPRFKGVRLNRAIAGRIASGSLTFTGQPADTETFVVGLKTYRMVDALAQENDILIGATVAETVTNIIAGINRQQLDVAVHEDTQSNYEAAGLEDADSDQVALVAALIKGESGNDIVLTSGLSNCTVTGSGTLAGGLDETSQPRQFPREQLYDRDGQVVIGVPLSLKQSTVEYAVRSLNSVVLEPDPAVDDTLVPVKRERAEAFEVEYIEGAQPRIAKPFPAADRLLAEYLKPAGGVLR